MSRQEAVPNRRAEIGIDNRDAFQSRLYSRAAKCQVAVLRTALAEDARIPLLRLWARKDTDDVYSPIGIHESSLSAVQQFCAPDDPLLYVNSFRFTRRGGDWHGLFVVNLNTFETSPVYAPGDCPSHRLNEVASIHELVSVAAGGVLTAVIASPGGSVMNYELCEIHQATRTVRRLQLLTTGFL